MRRLVVGCGSDPDEADEAGCSLLMMAARSGLAETVEMLIQHDATVDDTDDDGLTALAYAASYGQVTMTSDSLSSEGRRFPQGKQRSSTQDRVYHGVLLTLRFE